MIDAEKHPYVGDGTGYCGHTTWHGPNVVSICCGPWWDPIHNTTGGEDT